MLHPAIATDSDDSWLSLVARSLLRQDLSENSVPGPQGLRATHEQKADVSL